MVLRRLRHWQSFQEKEIQGCNSFLADRLIHANTVYIHQEQEQEAYRFEEQQNNILQASHSSALVNGLFFGFLSFSVNATFLALLTYGMTLVKKGTVSFCVSFFSNPRQDTFTYFSRERERDEVYTLSTCM